MDLITGAGVTVTVIVPLPRDQMWELITAVERTGAWSPETSGANCSTVVRQSLRHGPGVTGARLATLCSNMITTISRTASTAGVRR
ncbi:MAG TPA: hypothetical protein VN408_23050 [Actinoplanes sp.]|nr:hypothetical protein [Actinoplanes sp.]